MPGHGAPLERWRMHGPNAHLRNCSPWPLFSLLFCCTVPLAPLAPPSYPEVDFVQVYSSVRHFFFKIEIMKYMSIVVTAVMVAKKFRVQ